MSEVATLARGLIQLQRNGSSHLGINTGIPANSPSLRKLAGQRREAGWIVSPDGSTTGWRPTGFIEHEGRVHVYGPLFEGRTFDEIVTDPDADRLAAIAALASAFAALEAASIPLSYFHSRGYILAANGDVLVLPPDILEAIRDHQDYDERVSRMERFLHPDRNPGENAPFVVATSLYYVLTGHFPFEGVDEEELHARTRAASPLAAHMQDPTVRPDVSEALQTILTTAPGADNSSSADLAATIRGWIKSGARRELTDEERTAAETEAKQTSQRLEKTFRRREGIRRNGRRALVITVIAIIVGSVPATIIRNALAPRATAGLPPEEVVSAFFMSINELDHMTMEDAVIDDAGQALVREVTNIFVLDRQRMSVEMQSGYVDAAEWRENGMPAVGATRSPYGVYDLRLETLSAPDGEAAYRAIYERWLPDFERAEESGILLPLGTLFTDEVRLRMDREDWVIYSLETVDAEILDLDELRAEQSGS